MTAAAASARARGTTPVNFGGDEGMGAVARAQRGCLDWRVTKARERLMGCAMTSGKVSVCVLAECSLGFCFFLQGGMTPPD